MSDPKPRQPLTLKGVLTLVGAGLLYLLSQALGLDLGGATADPAAPPERRDDTRLIEQYFEAGTADRIVEDEGEVVHVLPLDDEGSRHQNFLVRISPTITLKVSHNIDLAPEVPLRVGDTLRFHGEYEWNEKGGVVHWTHRDPRNRHEHGWLEHQGKRYE